jgi:hypothetical protein
MLRQLNLLKQLEQVDRELLNLPSLDLEHELESSSSHSEDADDDSQRDSESDSDLYADDELLEVVPEALWPPRDAEFSGLHDYLAEHSYWQDRANPRESHLLRTHTVEQWFHQRWFDNPRLFRVHFRWIVRASRDC